MKSVIAETLKLETEPVALVWANAVPEDAIRFKPQHWGCSISLFAAAAARGLSGVLERKSYGCWGGGVGLGFGNQYEKFPGGVDCFYRFLSQGNEEVEEGRALGEEMKSSGWSRMADDFLKGERYIKNPEATRRFVEALPMRDIPVDFVLIKPLEKADPEREDIKNVTLFVDADRLAALVNLASCERPEAENVIVPWAAACQVVGIFAYRELEREHPRGLIGMMDISARKNVRASLGPHALSFTAPWPLFQEMEQNVKGSFLERETWRSLRENA
jgi:hypothetical protein